MTATPTLVCTWREVDNYDCSYWQGDCGAEWQLEDGTPPDNEMNFCPKCGRPLVAVPFVEEVEDEE